MAAEPSGASDADSPNFEMLARTIRQAFPSVVVSPYLVVGATDARHYAGLSPDVYGFRPVRMTAEDLKLLHGVDERVSVAGYEQCVKLYRLPILNSAG